MSWQLYVIIHFPVISSTDSGRLSYLSSYRLMHRAKHLQHDMPLESTVIWLAIMTFFASSYVPSLDTSEWMRNGDFPATRMEAEVDAALLLCRAKLQSHPDSTVAVLTMGAKSVVDVRSWSIADRVAGRRCS